MTSSSRAPCVLGLLATLGLPAIQCGGSAPQSAAPTAESAETAPSGNAPADDTGGPAESWWTRADGCPEGTKLSGKPPPDGDSVWCERANGKKHGPFTAWFKNGRKSKELAYHEGVEDGGYTTWYDNGSVSEE